jgi:hypothetical protein
MTKIKRGSRHTSAVKRANAAWMRWRRKRDAEWLRLERLELELDAQRRAEYEAQEWHG